VSDCFHSNRYRPITVAESLSTQSTIFLHLTINLNVLPLPRSPTTVYTSMRSSLGGLSLFIELVSASRTFQPNCTIPSEIVNLVHPPTVRGTFDILWSSAFTLFTCTWTVQHLNIPEQIPEGPNPFWVGVRWSLKRVWLKLDWMIVSLIVPEFLVGRALQDYMMARKSHKKMLERHRNMGGWTMTHAFYANMGGFVLKRPSPNIANHINEEEHIDAEEMIEVLDSDISNLPSEQEIQDKSKGDIFVKGTAVVQVLWLLVQVIARDTRNLPTSQLEISVLAFSVCAFITYLFFWGKPQNVMTPTYITTAVEIRPRSNPRLGTLDPNMPTRIRWFQGIFLGRSSLLTVDRSRSIPNDIEYTFLHETIAFSYIDIGATFAGAIFGALHCLAWHFPFPTLTERLLWRVAALFITAIPPTLLLALQCAWTLGAPKWVDILESRKEASHPWVHWLVKIGYHIVVVIVAVIFLSYATARLYLIVETFRALLFLPPEVFVTTWSTQIPHVG